MDLALSSLKGMVNYMKYELKFFCEKDGDRIEQAYDVEFLEHPNPYGNGMIMVCENHKAGYTDYNYDIRYDMDYDKDNEMSYIISWVNHMWSGNNGSYKAKEITIKEIA